MKYLLVREVVHQAFALPVRFGVFIYILQDTVMGREIDQDRGLVVR